MARTIKQDMQLYKIRDQCLKTIKRRGARSEVTIIMPGTWRKKTTRKYSWSGPRGRICARTHDGRKIVVAFPAVQLCKSVEGLIHGNITG